MIRKLTTKCYLQFNFALKNGSESTIYNSFLKEHLILIQKIHFDKEKKIIRIKKRVSFQLKKTISSIISFAKTIFQFKVKVI